MAILSITLGGSIINFILIPDLSGNIVRRSRIKIQVIPSLDNHRSIVEICHLAHKQREGSISLESAFGSFNICNGNLHRVLHPFSCGARLQTEQLLLRGGIIRSKVRTQILSDEPAGGGGLRLNKHVVLNIRGVLLVAHG